MQAIISLRQIRKGYSGAPGFVRVLEDFDLEIRRGEFVALMGPSGAGKSTLLHLIGGLDQPDGGEIVVAETHLEGLSSRRLAPWRAAHIGFVFQSHNLLNILSAAENVELPLLLQPLSRTERQHRVAQALKEVGLADRATHKPGQLSGGQQQRVGIARALIARAPILLCDEPTADLDVEVTREILQLLQTLARSGRTIVMVTHDPQAAQRADRQVLLSRSGH